MRDPQLYKAIEASRLSEVDRCVAVAAMKKGERFADAVKRMVRGIRKLRSRALGKRAPSYHEHVTEGRGI